MVDITEYLGKGIVHGELVVFALISIEYNSEWYEGLYIYNKDIFSLTTDDNLLALIGEIEEWDHYGEIVVQIQQKLVPFDEVINILDDLNVEIED